MLMPTFRGERKIDRGYVMTASSVNSRLRYLFDQKWLQEGDVSVADMGDILRQYQADMRHRGSLKEYMVDDLQRGFNATQSAHIHM